MSQNTKPFKHFLIKIYPRKIIQFLFFLLNAQGIPSYVLNFVLKFQIVPFDQLSPLNQKLQVTNKNIAVFTYTKLFYPIICVGYIHPSIKNVPLTFPK
jgi:hypothetical protein